MNLASILIVLLLVCAVAAVIRKLARDKKQGKSSCSCGCSACVMSGSCHKSRNS